MTDEKYTFISDCKDKKRIARGSFNKKTHAGKGGAIKFPSDYMTKKEIKKMSGECVSYRLDAPMTWSEFRSMPKDIQKEYVENLKKRFDMTSLALAKMLGISRSHLSKTLSDLHTNIDWLRNNPNYQEKDNAFYDWVSGVLPEGAIPDTDICATDVSVAKSETTVEPEIMVSNFSDEASLKVLIKRYISRPSPLSVKDTLQFISTVLQEAFDADIEYDITDMRHMILCIAMNAKHDSNDCIKLVNEMHFKSPVKVKEEVKTAKVIPERLSMTLCGTAEDIYNILNSIYGDQKATINISTVNMYEPARAGAKLV